MFRTDVCPENSSLISRVVLIQGLVQFTAHELSWTDLQFANSSVNRRMYTCVQNWLSTSRPSFAAAKSWRWRASPMNMSYNWVDLLQGRSGQFSFVYFVHVIYGRGSVLLWRRCDTLCPSGFMDDVILAHKPRQPNVAVQLMEAQPSCSLGLGYKLRVRIPFVGPIDSHSRAYFSVAAVWAY